MISAQFEIIIIDRVVCSKCPINLRQGSGRMVRSGNPVPRSGNKTKPDGVEFAIKKVSFQ